MTPTEAYRALLELRIATERVTLHSRAVQSEMEDATARGVLTYVRACPSYPKLSAAQDARTALRLKHGV